MNDPVLSICIPTFNRCEQLRLTLESIASQDAFSNSHDVEVVVSDNNSSDKTEDVVGFFSGRFPGKIKYNKNPENVGADKNLEISIRHSRGEFIKLHNDNFPFINGALSYLLNIIQVTREEKPVIFCKNNNDLTNGWGTMCNDLDSFVKAASFVSGWCSGFGIWRSHYEELDDFSRNADLQLVTTDVLFRIIASGKRSLVVNTQLFYSVDPGKKGGYSLAKVFGINYLNIMGEYVRNGKLSVNVFSDEKKKVFLGHIVPYYFSENHNFKIPGFFKNMYNYWNEPYFQETIEKLLGIDVSGHVEPVAYNPLPALQASTASDLNSAWRVINPHNETYLTRSFDLRKIKVGNHSYGPLAIWSWDNCDEFITIGHFVSIAENVSFLLGGNHRYDTPSTYPFGAKFFNMKENQALTKGPIVVEDDVWIGHGSTILSGVTIGKGAIISAGSVVTKDVAPYTIVGGGPAKFIKYRFDEELIDELKGLDYSLFTDDFVFRNQQVLSSVASIESVRDLKKVLIRR